MPARDGRGTAGRMTLARIDHVAIVSAGFSGTLQAINLLRHDGPRITLIERRPVVARGTAYSTLQLHRAAGQSAAFAGAVAAPASRIGHHPSRRAPVRDRREPAETIDVRGKANRRLLALGPMTRGTFWETVAKPDIRRQTWDMARRLAKAQWVEGEGL